MDKLNSLEKKILKDIIWQAAEDDDYKIIKSTVYGIMDKLGLE